VVSLVLALEDALREDEDEEANASPEESLSETLADLSLVFHRLDATGDPHKSKTSFAGPPVSLLSQLVLRSASYASQFVEAGGLDSGLTKRLLDPKNQVSILVDALLAISQIARLGADKYVYIKASDACCLTVALLSHHDCTVRARSCNVLGNMCRHSSFFYKEFAEQNGTAEYMSNFPNPASHCLPIVQSTRLFAHGINRPTQYCRLSRVITHTIYGKTDPVLFPKNVSHSRAHKTVRRFRQNHAQVRVLRARQRGVPQRLSVPAVTRCSQAFGDFARGRRYGLGPFPNQEPLRFTSHAPVTVQTDGR
jgi:hypothetical protein